MKRNKNKGFTLVELLVVIVIMCILAAILIPTFAKYVKRAQNATIIAEARAAHVAASVLAQDAVVKGDTPLAAYTNDDLLVYTDVTGSLTNVTYVGAGETPVRNTGVIDGFTYTDGDGKTVTYNGEVYEVTP